MRTRNEESNNVRSNESINDEYISTRWLLFLTVILLAPPLSAAKKRRIIDDEPPAAGKNALVRVNDGCFANHRGTNPRNMALDFIMTIKKDYLARRSR